MKKTSKTPKSKNKKSSKPRRPKPTTKQEPISKHVTIGAVVKPPDAVKPSDLFLEAMLKSQEENFIRENQKIMHQVDSIPQTDSTVIVSRKIVRNIEKVPLMDNIAAETAKRCEIVSENLSIAWTSLRQAFFEMFDSPTLKSFDFLLRYQLGDDTDRAMTNDPAYENLVSLCVQPTGKSDETDISVNALMEKLLSHLRQKALLNTQLPDKTSAQPTLVYEERVAEPIKRK